MRGTTDRKLKANRINHLIAISLDMYMRQILIVPITRPITKGTALHTAIMVPPMVISYVLR
jgi:hypothetical protein